MPKQVSLKENAVKIEKLDLSETFRLSNLLETLK
jgi:hypothetical protein